MRTISVLGTAFSVASMTEQVEAALACTEERNAKYIVTPNTEILLDARHSAELREALSGAERALPDGIGVIYASRILKTPIPEKQAGSDFVMAFFERLSQEGKSVFLLGGKPGVAEAAAETLRERFPGLRIAGIADGYFTDEKALIETINAASPDFLPVCLGAPRQELWMARHARELSVGVMAGLGGVMDLLAGKAKRAPHWMISLGLEWFYRLLREPTRITRMYRLPWILVLAFRERLWKK